MELIKNELVKDVNGYEGIYAVTTEGRVWSHRRMIFLKRCTVGHGYLGVVFSVDGKQMNCKVHKLVANAFIENPDNKPQINHKNGNKKDCRVTNLQWVTARENIQHAGDMGLNKVYKLSYQDKVAICDLYFNHQYNQNVIAFMFRVTPPAISYLVKTYPSIIGNA